MQSVLHGKAIQRKDVKNEGRRILINIFSTIISLFVFFLSYVQVVEGMYNEGDKVINNVDVILLILNWVPSLSADNKR